MFLISVIIPFYNSEKYIAETINSVLEQTYPNFEIICVNNNSNDNSLEIVKNIKEKNRNKVFLIEEHSKGANFARNTGLNFSKGEVVQFLDADDILEPTKFEAQLKGFDTPGVNVVVSDRVSMNESLTEIIYKHDFSTIEKKPLNTVISQIIITGNPLYRKSFIMQIGAWDVKLPNAQDWELNIRAVLQGANFKYIKGDFLISRGVYNSLSSNWLSVSNTSAQIIIKNYSKICAQSEKLESSSMKKIFFIFYLSALNTNRDQKKEYCNFILNNITGWKSYINNPFKRLIAYALGLNGLVAMEKKLKND